MESIFQEPPAIFTADTTNKRNLLLLAQLRWLAVGGQVVTIVFVHFRLGIALPLTPMAGVIYFLIALNVVTLLRRRNHSDVTNTELFLVLMLDVAALTAQLYLSGGASNPFISVYLLQVIIGAVLLEAWSVWTLVTITSACYIWLTTSYHEIGLSGRDSGTGPSPGVFDLHIYGMFICFVLVAVLLVIFITRINQNLRNRDLRLAALRQQSLEEEHIVRMGLLASGAAHELGTPLGTISVILGDWARMPNMINDRDAVAEIEEMEIALARCKEIVSRILVSSGQARGEGAERTTRVKFFDRVVVEWQEARAPRVLEYTNRLGSDYEIASDTVLKQILVNVFDNAFEASPDWLKIDISERDGMTTVRVSDRGAGFSADMLAALGKPYQTTKSQPGRGLGLFLVVNVMRKLGGSVTAVNNRGKGATVELRLPMIQLAL
jgi:two-component system sensor histidine kinase RegB